MIFLMIFNTSICHHITVKYKFRNLPHHHKDQIHFSGHHFAGFHQSAPHNQNHFQSPRHIHIRLHIFRLLKSHLHLCLYIAIILHHWIDAAERVNAW